VCTRKFALAELRDAGVAAELCRHVHHHGCVPTLSPTVHIIMIKHVDKRVGTDPTAGLRLTDSNG
jgi:hypothetical protein